jgi:DNA-binding MarR family transcriptional regulator
MVNDVIADPLAVANELRPVLLRLSRELRKETEQLGVTSRQVTLLWLIRGNPGLSLRELAAEEGISAPALSGHVDRLEKAS